MNVETQNVENIREEVVQIGDLASKYIDKSVGTSFEIEIQQIRQINVLDAKDPKHDYCLSGVDFYYEIDCLMEGQEKVLSIGAWKLWNAIRAVTEKAGQIEGTKLKVSHTATAKYDVELVEE